MENSKWRKKISINNKTMELSRFVYLKEKGFIPIGFVIHHIDGDPFNNNIENLQAISQSEHKKIHESGKHFLGRKLPERQKQNIREGLLKFYLKNPVWNKGIPSMTDYNKQRLLEAQYKKNYKEIGKKISETKMGHTVDEIVREKIRIKLIVNCIIKKWSGAVLE